MEAGFYQADLGVDMASPAPQAATVSTDWRQSMPVLTSGGATLRELELSDAPALLAMLTTPEVTRFISPPPTTVEGFERFILRSHQQRAAGSYVCFAVVPKGMSTAVGLFQLRALSSDFSIAEWGFALGSSFWGTGVFTDSAHLVIDFAFEAANVRRLEARASVENGRGNAALKKLGATAEGVLRRSFLRYGRYHDQILWSILHTDPRQPATLRQPIVH